MRRARDLKFGTQTHGDNISKTGEEKFRKGAWPRSRDPYKFWHTPQNISTMHRARDLKFGSQTHRGNISKTGEENSEKGRGLGRVTLINFGIPPKISPIPIELET